MKFIHIADVHLGVLPDKGRPWSDMRAQEVVAAFDGVLAKAEQEQVDLLLIAGDLFHAPPGIADLEEVDYKFSRLSRTKVVLIAGNHDHMAPLGIYSQYRFRSGAVCLATDHLQSVYIKEANTCVVGRSYDRQEIYEGIYDEAKPARSDCFNILLAHGGDTSHAPLDKGKLLNAGFDYVALGHIHKPAILQQDKMAYSGSLEPIDHTDVGDRGYIMGEITDRGCHVRWYKINTRNYINLSLTVKPEYTNAQMIDGISKEIERLGRQHIYRVILKGEKSPDRVMDLEQLERNYYISAIEDQTRGSYNLEEIWEDHQDDMVGQFIGRLYGKDDEISQKALEYGLQALLEGE